MGRGSKGDVYGEFAIKDSHSPLKEKKYKLLPEEGDVRGEGQAMSKDKPLGNGRGDKWTKPSQGNLCTGRKGNRKKKGQRNEGKRSSGVDTSTGG